MGYSYVDVNYNGEIYSFKKSMNVFKLVDIVRRLFSIKFKTNSVHIITMIDAMPDRPPRFRPLFDNKSDTTTHG